MRDAGTWRPMREGDLDAVTAISDAVHGRHTEPRAVYAERLNLYPAGCRVFDRSGVVCGYVIAHPWSAGEPPKLGEKIGTLPAEAARYYLHDIALLPETRGAGAARSALAGVVAQARAIGSPEVLLVAVGGADRFWAAMGFEYLGTAGPSYGPGSHRMRLALAAV